MLTGLELRGMLLCAIFLLGIIRALTGWKSQFVSNIVTQAEKFEENKMDTKEYVPNFLQVTPPLDVRDYPYYMVNRD
jgi:hypothetical protein